LTAGQAIASHVQCGDVITEDTALDSDLIDCDGTALTIGADDITLNLASHRVGDCCYPDSTGIDDEGHRGVVIENGRVLGVTGIRLTDAHETVLRDLDVFGPFAVSLTHSSRNRLVNSTIGTSYVAVSLDDSDHNAIQASTINGYYYGIDLEAGSDDNRVEDSLLSAERYGPALRVQDSRSNRFRRNRLRSTFTGVALIDAQGNEVTETSGLAEEEGIVLLRSEGNLVSRNSLSAGQCKICLSGADNNVIRANELASRRFYSELGMRVFGSGNRIEHNEVAAIYAGIRVEAGARNALIGNVASGSDGNGIVVAAQASDTLVSKNEASRNGADGILLEDSTGVLSRNVANGNGDFGIEAASVASDGGGNRAFGNTNPLQCLNVVCKTKRPRK
jgi:parallel beta-helix repeat protein